MKVFIINNIKNYWHIIIPIITFSCWAVLLLIAFNFKISKAGDFPAIYLAGKYIFTHPELIYTAKVYPRYPYGPCFATVFAPISLLPYDIAAWILFFILYISGLLILFEFNKILKLKNIKNPLHRFLFLIVLSNGLRFYEIFGILQTKLIVSYFLILFLRREIEARKNEEDLNGRKFLFTQLLILAFAISLIPQYFFMVIIYLFNNIKIKQLKELKEIFNNVQIRRYFLMIFAFLSLNFMFIIIILKSPNAFNEFVGGGWRGNRYFISNLTHSYIEKNYVQVPVDSLTNILWSINLYFDISNLNKEIYIVSIISMIIITIILSFKKNFTIEKKFGYFALLSLFLNTFYYFYYLVIFLPLIAILFIHTIENSEAPLTLTFIKRNSRLLFGLLCISILYFMPLSYYLLDKLPFLYNIPLALIISRWTIVYVFLVISLYLLNKIKK